MSEGERVVRELYDAFNSGDFDRAAAQFAAQCEYESIASGSVARTPREFVEGLRAWATAFPDGHVEMTNEAPSGSRLPAKWARVRPAGVPLDDDEAVARDRGCAVAEVEDGHIVRYRDYYDRANMLEPANPATRNRCVRTAREAFQP